MSDDLSEIDLREEFVGHEHYRTWPRQGGGQIVVHAPRDGRVRQVFVIEAVDRVGNRQARYELPLRFNSTLGIAGEDTYALTAAVGLLGALDTNGRPQRGITRLSIDSFVPPGRKGPRTKPVRRQTLANPTPVVDLDDQSRELKKRLDELPADSLGGKAGQYVDDDESAGIQYLRDLRDDRSADVSQLSSVISRTARLSGRGLATAIGSGDAPDVALVRSMIEVLHNVRSRVGGEITMEAFYDAMLRSCDELYYSNLRSRLTDRQPQIQPPPMTAIPTTTSDQTDGLSV